MGKIYKRKTKKILNGKCFIPPPRCNYLKVSPEHWCLYLGIGKTNTGTVNSNPGTPFNPQHQGTHREYHSQNIPDQNNFFVFFKKKSNVL